MERRVLVTAGVGATVFVCGIDVDRLERATSDIRGHCLRGTPGGVAVLAIDDSPTRPSSSTLPVDGERCTLAASGQGAGVRLNGRALCVGDDVVPEHRGQPVPPGAVDLASASIVFLGAARAGNPACR